MRRYTYTGLFAFLVSLFGSLYLVLGDKGIGRIGVVIMRGGGYAVGGIG